MVIAVAIDENFDAVRGFAAGITFPVLMDPSHDLTELYAISNVPTVVMIDEHDRIVHPNWSAFGTDTFREFTGIDSDRQHDRVRDWVRDGATELAEDVPRLPEEDADRRGFIVRGDADVDHDSALGSLGSDMSFRVGTAL